MELTDEQIAELETILQRLATIDPVRLPEPAAELAALLGSILDEVEQT